MTFLRHDAGPGACAPVRTATPRSGSGSFTCVAFGCVAVPWPFAAVVPAAVPSVLLACALLAGCNLAPRYERPVGTLPVAVDAAGLHGGATLVASAQALEQARELDWVQSPALLHTVALALTHNRDVRVAVDNIEKARAQYGVTRAAQLPALNAQAQQSRSRGAGDLSASGTGSISTQYTAQIGFTSFELDLWGRVRNLGEAGLQQFLQSEQNQRSVQLGLVADVATAWLTLAAQQQRLALARATLVTREHTAELTAEMLRIGATSGLTVAQVLAQRDAAAGDVALYEAEVRRSRNALYVLVGGPLPQELLPVPQQLPLSQYPDLVSGVVSGGAAVGSGAEPPAPAVADSDSPLALAATLPEIPATVLLRRPDVLAAEHYLRAMHANVGAARAALFPTISLTGSTGRASRELDALFASGNQTWSLVPQIRLPIFDGGAARAGVAVAEANQRMALAQYEKTVQTAFREVADSLSDREQWALRLAAQHSQLHALHKAAQLAQARFDTGADSYLTVLDAQRTLYAAQQTQIGLQLSAQLNRVMLWKVLGGQALAALQVQEGQPGRTQQVPSGQ